MKTGSMTERQATKAWHDGKITLKQYQAVLRRIAGNRHRARISKTVDRSSMSSSKWR